MVAIGRSSHAYFFDGVSDSIIIPQGRFRKTGTTNPQGNKVSINTLDSSDDRTNINRKNDSEFIIESWVIPDCGGIIASRDGQFTLEIGTVDTPGPAVFTIATESMQGQSLVKLTTAFDVTTRWDGIVYPQQEHAGMHFSYNRYDSSAYNEATNLNFNNRPLYHVVAGLSKGSVFLAINGETVASQTVSEDIYIARSTNHIYVGGKGGQFRGAIEAIHMTNDYDEEMMLPHIPVKGNHTAALYRFEEPIDIIEESYTFTALGSDSASPYAAATNGTTTTLTISATDAQALIARLTGKAYDSTSATTDFRVTPYSMGNYKLTDYYTSPTSPTTIATAHTPYNLLINPGAVNRNSQKPNLSPPERVRLHSINGSSGVITVSSIHVDFINGTNGLRGVLHSRTSDVDNYFVVIGADLLIDNGTGKPYQPPHYGTQIFDKTGQMTIDESNFENHGFVYSSRMATTTSDPNNPFAVTWPAAIDELFQIGHSGRHVFSHVTGHEYMRRFPKPTDIIVDQQIDGSADIVEMVYDNSTKSIQDMFTMNALVDFYNPAINAPIVRIKNTSSVASILNNGLPVAKRELIAIGGSGFDYAPFALKGPVPEYGDINDTTRLYHLVPEAKSRVALLYLPALKASYDYAPFVEIHYNAIDLTGASMGLAVPMLMVEKTVPAGSHIVTGSTRILDVIAADLANATLYSPGGIITIGSAIDGFGASLEDSHTLLGDNTGGQENDSELDYSTTPALYTPDNDATAVPASPPKPIVRSHNSGVHESVYHKLCIEPRTSTIQNSKTDNDNIGNFTLQPLTEKSGTGVFDIGPTSSSSSHFEIFDIIDNIRIYDEVGIYCKIFIQPSNKLRSNQLSTINTLETDTVPNIAGILTLMSRCRIRGIRKIEDAERNAIITTVLGKGISDSFVNENVSAIGSGSPDSHILKEIEPNSPVVTVNLGGPGQGAVNTKPTFDPSPLMRLPGSTRRNCIVQAVFIDSTAALGFQTLSVTPLNNASPDMQSWGTICFPKVGRIYLEDGASAAYTSKLGAGFYFSDTNAVQEGTFLDAAGVAYATIHDWANATGLYTQGTAGDFQISAYISNDPNFDNSNLTQDGSTVNDRLFQSMDGVTHDYQLGTQYASTRALVEIPVFPKQFFDHTTEGIFPGPDNSMKIHVDATYTAHTWNPSPVGRRADDIEVSDKSAYSAYSYIVKNKDYVKSATITKVEEVSNDLRVFVSHPKMFPDGSGERQFGNLEERKTRRRVFLSTGDWGVYDNDAPSNGYLSIPLIASGGYSKGLTEAFRQNATVGTKIHIGAGIINETLLPITSDLDVTSSDYEGRSPFYYDSANMQTQGGNLDYGLRQYVSAVEFKAGPLANPHASRIETKRASAKIVNVQSTVTSGITHLVITLDDASLFPDIELSSVSGALEAGDKIYVGEIGTATAVECYYLGRDALAQVVGNKNSILAVLPGNTSVTLNDLIGVDFTLLRAGHTLKAISDPANAIGTYELGLNTFLPPTAEKWAPSVASSAGTVTEFNIAPTTATRIANANTIGLNIRKGDKLFGLAGSNYTYIGEVSEVHDPTYSEDSVIEDATCDTDHTAGTGTTFGDNPKIVKCDSTAKLHVGMLVTGTGIPSTTRILTIVSGTLFTIDKDTTATNDNTTLTFTGDTRIKLAAANTGAIATNQTIVIGAGSVMQDDQEAILNRSWLYPYAQGGLRNGDTVWMNMTMNNPHAIEGLFAKSRGVFNEAHVYTGFNGGRGSLTARPRDSIPLENFLIGDSCLETAQNFVQHINKTVEMNYEAFGLTATQAPTVAYVDPYLATDGHARVLLFDVAHDREFIALHDLHMQVQSSATTPTIGHTRNVAHAAGTIKLDKHLISINGGAPHYFTTQIDVANGFPSENKFLRSTQQSKFIESAYAHNIPSMTSKDLTGNSGGSKTTYTLDDPATLGNNPHRRGKGHGHFVHTGLYHEATSDIHSVGDSTLPRVESAVASVYWANQKHNLSFKRGTGNLLLKKLKSHRMSQGFATHTLRDTSTMFDTPDGTRVISAFLCLKGKRNTALDLSSHEENATNRKINSLKHWTEMDFVRRMTVDMGEVGVKEGVTDIEAAAREIVRMINQGGALNGRTHARRPSQQYPGESSRLDLTRIGVRADTADENRDASSAHINADFAATGSTYDPSPFWDGDAAFETHDRGSHMGYVRAHLGRVVEDINGNEGFSIVIHSTIPGASGRNFCVWLDNSKGQSTYQPQFLLGHGGRFRNFWAQPDEMMGENMHPAPMPLNKHGRPFAPVTTLRELVPQEEPDEAFTSNHDIAPRRDNVSNPVQRNVSAHLGGISQNTVNDESFESQSPSSSLLKGLRAGKGAISRVNFGGLVASGVPGFSPIAGKHGLGRKGSTEFDKIYGEAIKKGGTAPTAITSYSTHVKDTEIREDAIGDSTLYGLRFSDHRGRGYGLRYIYRQMGEKFANDLTTIPSTLDDEVCIFFDDRDVAQGGFTIGHHMLGWGDATGRIDNSGLEDDISWRGNQWRGVPAPSVGIDSFIQWTGTNMTVTLDEPYDTSSSITHHPDILGYLGFPKENGVIQVTDPFTSTTRDGSTGTVLSYESRTQNKYNGTHKFHGVRGPTTATSHSLSATNAAALTNTANTLNNNVIVRVLLSPRVNWTTLITDEVIAAATAHAINLQDPNIEEGFTFDCTNLYAADGKTLGEWGVSPDAIKIRAHNPQRGAVPLSTMFSATLHKDLGIEAPHIEFGAYEKLNTDTNNQWTIVTPNDEHLPLSDSDIDANAKVDCGYIPRTVLQIRTKSRGYHTNTPTPILVDSYNDPVDTSKWANNLKGISYLSISGDLILPKLNNAIVMYTSYDHTGGAAEGMFTLNGNENLTHLMLSAGRESIFEHGFAKILSFGEEVQIWYGNEAVANVAGLHGAITDSSCDTDHVSAGGDATTFRNNIRLIQMLSTAKLVVGMGVSGIGVAVGSTVTAINSGTLFTVSADTTATNDNQTLTFTIDPLTKLSVLSSNEKWTELFAGDITDDGLLMLHGDKQFSGHRQYGSIESEPITYFKGGRDSNDHSVPLYFGGGFSGVVLDINDGTKNDYSSFYTHPYSTGPTGTAGIQNANEISTSFAMLDCNAILAFFPGTAFLNQHRGSSTPPAFNKTAILSPDLEVGNYSHTASRPSHLSARYTAGIVPQKAVPLVVRFPHQNANYTDHKTSNNYFTSYLIFGPGQSFPFTETTDANDNIEPHPGYVVTTGNTWSKMPHGVSLPNEIKNSDNKYGPPSSTYQSRRQRFQYQYTSNWSPPEGLPNVGDVLFTDATCDTDHASGGGDATTFGHNVRLIQMDSTAKLVVGMGVTGTGIPSGSTVTITAINSGTLFTVSHDTDATNNNQTLTFTFGTSRYGLGQRPEHGYHYGQHFENPVPGKVIASRNEEDYLKAHPYQHAAASYYGIAMSADLTWHMDGGYLPGGNWLDQQMSFNPPMEKSDYRVVRESVVGQINQTAFRASGVVGATWLAGASNEEAAYFFRDTILVDATRCQNGEELAYILGQAINENPGSGALKALGGTFAPSMGTAHRQDRYAWVELTYLEYSANTSGNNESGSNLASNSVSTALTFSNSKNYVMARGATGTSVANQNLLEQLPASGWVRTDKGGRLPSDPTGADAPAFGCYHSREVFLNGSNWVVIFNLAPNRISGMPFMEDITTWDNKCEGTAALSFPEMLGTGDLDLPTKVYAWSKSGVNTFMNNVGDAPNLYPRSRVHFSGVVDAIDRTRPIGAVGWAGERYSYLNSLGVGGNFYSGGLGAWHPMLGFSPYGKASSVMSTFAHQPHITPIKYAPESTGPISGWGTSDTVLTTAYTWNTSLASTAAYSGYTGSTTPYVFENTHVDNYGSKPIHITNEGTDIIPKTLHQNQGVFSRGFLVISYEGELPLVAKRDRDGITGMGDWLAVKSKTLQSVAAATALTFAGTTQWKERIHDSRRFVAPANGGPNIEALTVNAAPAEFGATIPIGEIIWNSNISTDTSLVNATPCVAATGDLFFDLDESPGSFFLESTTDVERNIASDFISAAADLTGQLKAKYGPSYTDGAWLPNINPHYAMRNRPADNFTIENIVWKRMDGGNLSLPASNARGLGAVPFVTRIKSDGTAYTMGEELLGNNRFTFETTNSAMFPIIQAQELSHPQLASQHPNELRNVLTIPNEEIQFEEIMVEDDTGQTHIIEGGSPFGTIIRTYNTVSDRSAEGLAPSVANSGTEPNLKIRLPDPETIPGNLIIRPGFGALQAYQTETIGSGGMMRPISKDSLKHLFTDETTGPRLGPTFSDHNWEHISQAATGEAFPDSTYKGWEIATGNAPLETSYELHDRTLFFHVTKNGNSHSHRYPYYYGHASGVLANELTAVSFSGTTLTVNANPLDLMYDETAGPGDTRRFLRLYDPTTGKSGVASFLDTGTNTFTTVVGDADFQEIVKGTITSYKVVPSYYIPAGSTRFFAARRMRDHAEVSGNSPDTAHTLYYAAASEEIPKVLFTRPQLSPLAIPRMGHHFVTPTMAMLPGHWAHPAYQGLYNKHLARRSATLKSSEYELIDSKDMDSGNPLLGVSSDLTNQLHGYDTQMRFGSLSATPSGPSDIHGGAFTLMFETKVRSDGYGVLASEGQAGVVNSKGGHTVVLEAAATYTLKHHFPDPSEVGAYQIIIQPNVHKSQLMGYHANGPTNNSATPDGSVNELTSQQVGLVIGIREPTFTIGGAAYNNDPTITHTSTSVIKAGMSVSGDGIPEGATVASISGGAVTTFELSASTTGGAKSSQTLTFTATGAMGLVLADATMADTRGCEIFINELMIDHDPDHMSQFTNIPPLMTYNPLGVQSTESPAFVKNSLPYTPSMFIKASPGFSTNIPWWSIVHRVGPDDSTAYGFRHLTHHKFDNYYEFIRSSTGSIGCQITLAGYPSIAPDLYSEILENVSMNPVCTMVSVATNVSGSGNSVVTVDDARGFPKVPYYGNMLEYTDASGVRRTHTYTLRSGYDSSNMNKPKQFTMVDNSAFTSNLTAGTKIRLTRAYDFRPSGTIFTDSKSSMVTRVLPQLLQGSRDTNSLHMADAYLSMWHPNLGRPHTFYSDSSRTWLSPTSDRAVDKKPLNSMPEHFETIHYHDSTYYASLGPFTLRRKTPQPPYQIANTKGASASAVGGSNVAMVFASRVNDNAFTVDALTSIEGNPNIMLDGKVYSIPAIFTVGGGAYSGGTTITHTSSTAIKVGMSVSVPSSGHMTSTARVVSITDNTHFEINANTGGSTTGQTLTFKGFNSSTNTIVINETLAATITADAPVMIGGDGSMITAQVMAAAMVQGRTTAEYTHQGGQSDSSDAATVTMLNHFWPSGSRGGPLVSRLDGYGYVSTSWDFPREYTFDGPVWTDADDDGSYTVSSGVTKTSYDSITSPTRVRPFGYRFGLRQPYNKPQWSTYGARAFREQAVLSGTTNISSNYQHGPLIQQESQTWTYAGGTSGVSSPTYGNKYVGIMERQTNFSGMLGVDKSEMQVRYSNGMRVTRPFGCPVRTLRNASSVIRDWWGDDNGLGLTGIEQAAKYYLVDWWGNTRGEDVRRYPVRGFGIKPAWDSADVYEYDRTTNRTPFARLFNNGSPVVNFKHIVTTAGAVSVTSGYTIPRFGGRINHFNANTDTALVDVFMPTNAHRVGDNGKGHGLRYPTAFNEDLLTELNEPIHGTGVVLSHHTAEPNMKGGYIRARDDVLQPDEVPRGISARLAIAEDGLLKPDAVVSDRVEKIDGDSPHKDAVSRSSPRIGLDTENVEGVDENMIIINTEAHSLHTDRNVGQRVVLHGGMQAGSQTLADYDLTALNFGGQPQGGVIRLSHTSNFNPLGGTFLAETRNFVSPIDDSNWGGFTDATCDYNNDPTIVMDSTAKLVVGMTVTGTGIPSSATVSSITNATDFELSASTTGGAVTNGTLSFGPPTAMGSNPYATSVFSTAGKRANVDDKKVTYMMRPIRLLDKQHAEMFRPNSSLHSSSPQYGSNYFSATAGGKYGLYVYQVENGRATGGGMYMRSTSPDTNPPYAPAYLMDISASDTVPMSKGPKIKGTEVTTFDKTLLDNEVTRIVISENSLQHHRADASRRRSHEEGEEKETRLDYSIQPRFSQSLHQKGHKGDVTYNSTDHSGDGA